MKRIASMLLLLVTLCGLALLPSPARAQDQFDATITPTSGAPGTRFLGIATGYKKGEDVFLWLNAPDGSVTSVGLYNPYQAEGDGRIVWDWNAPADIQYGTWQFVARGVKSQVERTVSFQIATPANPTADIPYQVQPASGTPGQTFKFFATGFAAGETMDVRVYNPNDKELLRDVKVSSFADANGRIDGSATVPVDGAFGTWYVLAKGLASSVERKIPFEVVSPIPESKPQLEAVPASGKPGTRFLFSGTGYQSEEKLGVWLNSPDGRVVIPVLESRLDIQQAGLDGRVSLNWISPDDTVPGTWQLVVRGQESNFQQVVSFEIQ